MTCPFSDCERGLLELAHLTSGLAPHAELTAGQEGHSCRAL